ncbi:hypothetical protein AAHE18_20G102700 [Arachis hypogaea]
MKSVAATCVLMILVTSVTSSQATISSCSDVIKNLKPCVSYLMSGIAKPLEPCCSGIKALAATAATSADKKTAC